MKYVLLFHKYFSCTCNLPKTLIYSLSANVYENFYRILNVCNELKLNCI